MRPRPPTVEVLDEASGADVVDLAAARAARRSIARGPVTYPHVVEPELIEWFSPEIQQLHEDAARGRAARERDREGGTAAKRLHDERRHAWVEESERLRRALGIESRWERARRVAAKFRTPDRPGYPSRRTVYEYLGRVEGGRRRRPVT